MSIILVSFILLELLILSFAIYLIFGFISKTPFYPSSLKALDRLKDSGIIDLTKYNNFIDIGSGDGRIVRWGSKNGFQNSHGIEYNPYLSLYSRAKSIGHKGTKTFNKNFHNHNFENYDFVYLYIFSEHMNKIQSKLITELKPGSAIVTNTFKFSNLEPDLTFERFYIYFIK